MPIIKSAKKALRQSIKRKERNLSKKKDVKTLEKKFLRAIKEGKLDEAKTIFPKMQKSLDKAAKTNVLHKNTAARIKSRLAEKLKGK